MERPGTPRSARQILNRLNEVSFNAVLLKELDRLVDRRGRGVVELGRDHAAPPSSGAVGPYPAEPRPCSKLNAEWEFLAMLRDEGRRAADVFLAEHGDALGHRSSMDLDILLREV